MTTISPSQDGITSNYTLVGVVSPVNHQGLDMRAENKLESNSELLCTRAILHQPQCFTTQL